MDLIRGLNAAVEELEKDLTGELDLDRAARKSGLSRYNFQQVFMVLAGVTVTEYVRHRRLTLAARDLTVPGVRVVDVALKYGYDNPVSFARAFRAQHGLNPSEVGCPGASVRSYPRLVFEIHVEGAEPMEMRMEKKGAMRLVGYREEQTLKEGENLRRIPQFWQEKGASGEIGALLSRYNEDPGLRLLGVCANERGDEFDYYIATASGKAAQAPVEEILVPPAEYAVFPCSLSTLQETTRRIFAQWLPSSGCLLLPSPQLEWYASVGSEEDGVEIWIPVERKGE